MEARYRAHQDGTHIIRDDDRELIKDFTHWKIVENKFPYDAIFSLHHMIVSKRIFVDMADATDAERAELEIILKDLATEAMYDGTLENFPKGRSKPKHYHIHLFVWKYRDEN